MINLTKLNNIIEGIGANTFIDDLLARMTTEDLITTVNEIAAGHGIGIEATIGEEAQQ